MQLLTAGTVLPGPADERITDGAVLLDGDTIVAVGSRAAVEPHVAADVRRREFGPKAAIVPGLINAHVHLAFDASPTWLANLQALDDQQLLVDMAERAQDALRAGVTTVRDLGDRGGMALRLREAIARGDLQGPRLLSAGSPLTLPQGHCWFLGGEVSGQAEIRAQIRRTAEAGADMIKVMASGGQVTPESVPSWESQFSRSELEIIVQEARAAGLAVAAHAHGTESIADSVAAGVSTLEHCSWSTSVGADRRDQVAEEIVDRGIFVCHAVPSPWAPFLDRLGPERTEAAITRVRWMHERGVPLIAGTDAGLTYSEFDLAGGLGYLTELVGIPPAEVLEMATTRCADALGLERVGRLAAGCAADLLIVDGDPHQHLDALQARRRVLRGGQDVA